MQCVLHKSLPIGRLTGFLHAHFVSRGAGRHRAVALDPDGACLVVQQRTGNSGWVDTIWMFSVRLVGAGSALWPIAGMPPLERQMLRPRGERYRDYQSRTSMFFPLPQKGVVT
jgi:steroid 5-alpha reductase family enzyme